MGFFSIHSRALRLIGAIVVWLVYFAVSASQQATAQPLQPLTFLSPQAVPAPFLAVPYYGSEWINSYYDHEYPDYLRNNRIILYDGRVARHEYGDCGWDDLGNPIAYRLQPGGAECIWYEGHPGYDFTLDYEPVLAGADGQVAQARWWDWANRASGLGLFIEVDHNNAFRTRYGHLSAAATMTNTQVRRGQIIGNSGDTGNSSGAHLHFEVLFNGQPYDPFGGAGSSWLWLNGSWDAQGRWVGQPTPPYGTALVVDDDNPQTVGDPNDDPNFSKGHTINYQWEYCPPGNCPFWYRATGVGTNGDMLWTYGNDAVSDYWAWWRPPRPGLYDVQVFIPNSNGTTWWARYWLVSTYSYMPAIYTVVDQSGTYDRWISLGIYHFGTDLSAPWYAIWMNDATTENPTRDGHCGAGWCQIGVDAIRFRPVWMVYLPVVMKN